MSTNWKQIGKTNRNSNSNEITFSKIISNVGNKIQKGVIFDISGDNLSFGIGTSNPFSRLSFGDITNNGVVNTEKPGQLSAIALNETSTGNNFKGIIYNTDVKSFNRGGSKTNALQLLNINGDFSVDNSNNGMFYVTEENVTVIGGNPTEGNEVNINKGIIDAKGIKIDEDNGSGGNTKIVLDVKGSLRTNGYINFYNKIEGIDTSSDSFEPELNFWNDSNTRRYENIPHGSLWLRPAGNGYPSGLYFKNESGNAILISGQSGESQLTTASSFFDGSLEAEPKFIIQKSSITGQVGGTPIVFSGNSETKTTDINAYKNLVTITSGNLSVCASDGSNNAIVMDTSNPIYELTDPSGGIIWSQKQLLIGNEKSRRGWGTIDINIKQHSPVLLSYPLDPLDETEYYKPEKATNSLLLLTKMLNEENSKIGTIYDASATMIIGGSFKQIDTPASIISNEITTFNGNGNKIVEKIGNNIMFGRNNDLSGVPFSFVLGADNEIKNINTAVSAVHGGGSLVIGKSNMLKYDKPEFNSHFILGDQNNSFSSRNSFIQGTNNDNYGEYNFIFGNNNTLAEDNPTIFNENNNDYSVNYSFCVGQNNKIRAPFSKNIHNAILIGKNIELDLSNNNFTKDTDKSYVLLGSKASIKQNANPDIRFAFGTKEKDGNVFTIDMSGNTRIYGNLVVDGSRVILNTEVLDVSDNNISLNIGGNEESAIGGGITLVGPSAAIKWNNDGKPSNNYWDTSGADISTNNIYVNELNVKGGIVIDNLSLQDISANHFYTSDGNVDINGTMSIFTDISANDASFNRIDISGITNLGVFYSQPQGEDGAIMYNKTTKQFEGFSEGYWGGLGGVISKTQKTKILADSGEPSSGGNPDASGILFFTYKSEDSSGVRMVIDPSGRVGIGNINPVVALDVSGNLNIYDISANDISANAVYANNISANDISANYFYTRDGNIDINGTKSIFTDISANDASFNTISIGMGDTSTGDSTTKLHIQRGHLLVYGNPPPNTGLWNVQAKGAENAQLFFGCNNYYPGLDATQKPNGIIWRTRFEDNTDKNSAKIVFQPEANFYRGGIAFYTTNKINYDDSSDAKERMRIDMHGNVGIGVTDPSSNLHVQNNTANGNTKIICTGGFGGGGDAEYYFGQSLGYGGSLRYDADRDVIQINRRDNFVDHTVISIPYYKSNVGIGVVEPNFKLEVDGDISANVVYAKDLSANDISANHFYTRDGKVDINGTMSIFTDISANDASFNTINTIGKVGIGTDTPQAKLDVKAPYKTDELYETAGINFSTQNTGSDSWSVGYIGGYIAAGPNNDTGGFPGGLLFRTRSPRDPAQPGHDDLNVRMVINANGDVGIGNEATNPKSLLHLYKNTDDIVIDDISYSNVLRLTSQYESSSHKRGPLITFTNKTDAGGNLTSVTGSGSEYYMAAIGSHQRDVDNNLDDYQGSLSFYTKDRDDAGGDLTTLQERMTITHEGKVGIGKTNPYSLLDIQRVESAENKEATVRIFTGSSASNNLKHRFKNTALAIINRAYSGTNYSHDFSLVAGRGAHPTIGLYTKSAKGEIWLRNGTVDSPGPAGYISENADFDLLDHTVKIRANGDTYFNGGNVGIGTNVPGGILSIKCSKTTETTPTETTQWNGAIGLRIERNTGLGDVNAWEIVNGYHNSLLFRNIANNNTIESGTSNTLILDDNGNVGIGISVPNFKLEVDGDISANAVYAKDLSGNDISANHFYTRDGNVDINGTKSIFTDISANDASFNTINTIGNVGIGTTTPLQKLQVNGSILFGDGAVDKGYQQSGSWAIGLSAASGGTASNHDIGSGLNGFTGMRIVSHRDDGFLYDATEEGYSQNIEFYTHHNHGGTGDKTRMAIAYNGNIGIGVVEPNFKLEVDGDISANAAVYANDISANDISANHFYTRDGNVDINGTKSIFTDISTNDASFNTVHLSGNVFAVHENVSIGTADMPIKDLYLSSNSLYIGVKDGGNKGHKITITDSGEMKFQKFKREIVGGETKEVEDTDEPAINSFNDISANDISGNNISANDVYVNSIRMKDTGHKLSIYDLSGVEISMSGSFGQFLALNNDGLFEFQTPATGSTINSNTNVTMKNLYASGIGIGTGTGTNSLKAKLDIQDIRSTSASNEPAFRLYCGNSNDSGSEYENTAVSIIERSSLTPPEVSYSHLYGMVLGVGAHPTIGFRTKTSKTGTPTGVIELAHHYTNKKDFGSVLDVSKTVIINASGSTYFNGGNVGIGTDNPTELLDVSGNIRLSYDTDGNAPNIYFNCKPHPSTITNGLVWKTTDGNYQTGNGKESAKIAFGAEGGNYTGGLRFYTNNKTDNTTDCVERMRIDKDGKVGIGTNVPGGILSIKCSQTYENQPSHTTQWDDAIGLRIERSIDATAWEIVNGYHNSLLFRNITNTNAVRDDTSNTLILDDNGYVGIGIDVPGSTLDVSGIIKLSGSGLTPPTYACIYNQDNIGPTISGYKFQVKTNAQSGSPITALDIGDKGYIKVHKGIGIGVDPHDNGSYTGVISTSIKTVGGIEIGGQGRFGLDIITEGGAAINGNIPFGSAKRGGATGEGLSIWVENESVLSKQCRITTGTNNTGDIKLLFCHEAWDIVARNNDSNLDYVIDKIAIITESKGTNGRADFNICVNTDDNNGEVSTSDSIIKIDGEDGECTINSMKITKAGKVIIGTNYASTQTLTVSDVYVNSVAGFGGFVTAYAGAQINWTTISGRDIRSGYSEGMVLEDHAKQVSITPNKGWCVIGSDNQHPDSNFPLTVKGYNNDSSALFPGLGLYFQQHNTAGTLGEYSAGGSTWYYHVYNLSSPATGYTQPTVSSLRIGLRVEEASWVKHIAYSSDKRIKENIRDVSDNESLQKLRDISCVYYDYKDKFSRGFNTTIGFIAQQVREHMPIAVGMTTNIIPNEMRATTNPEWVVIPPSPDASGNIDPSANNTYKLTISDLSDNSGNTLYRFYVSNDPSGNDECKKEIYSLENEPKSFIFDQSWNYVLLYGKEVKDFHVLDKNKLFSLNFSATQEIDRIQQEEKTKLEEAELKIATLEGENATLKTQIADILSRLQTLENA